MLKMSGGSLGSSLVRSKTMGSGLVWASDFSFWLGSVGSWRFIKLHVGRGKARKMRWFAKNTGVPGRNS